MVRAIFLSLLILCILIESSAFGQAIFTNSSQPVNVYLLPYLQNWKLDSQNESKSVNQFSLPLFVNIRPTNNLKFWLIDSFSTSSLDKNGEKIDLIITDLHMPVMNGIEFIKAVRSSSDYKMIPILFLTTESQTEKKLEAKEAGATGWIIKPFVPAKLIAAVHKVLN